MARTAAEQLVQTLIEGCVRRVYGLVGDSLNPITDAIRRSETVEWLELDKRVTAAQWIPAYQP